MAEEITIELTEDNIDILLSSETISAELQGMSILYHNTLSGLQGGQANQFYHLTAADYAKVTNDAWVLTTGDQMTGTLDMTDNPIIDINYCDFNLVNGVAAAEGRLVWNDIDGTLNLGLKGGDVNLQIGLEMLIRGKNLSGSSSTNGRPGRMSGASGNNPTLAFSDLSSLATAESIGLFTEDITINSNGYLTTNGLVRDVNTSGSLYSETWLDGDRLYVGPTAGSLTNVLPSGTSRKIFIGIVLRAHATLGIIWVNPLNIYFLQELSGMSISSPQNGDVLTYESGVGTWTNVAVGSGLVDPRYVAVTGDEMSGTLQINVATTTDEALVLKSTDDNATNPLLKGLDSANAISWLVQPDGTFIRGAAAMPGGFGDVAAYYKSTTTIDLIINATGDAAHTLMYADTAKWRIRNDHAGASEADALVFSAGIVSPIIMSLLPSGKVGINTNAPSSTLHVVGNSNVIQVAIQAAVGQTTPLQEWQNSSGTPLSGVGPLGSFNPPSLADSAAPTNSIYYSTTAAKLVYKDSGGTVNNLY